MVSPVIDLSHHNPEPDWNALKAGGVVAAILKCTEGTSYVDDTYGQRTNAAKDAGVLTCPYHFLRPGNIQAQMDWFLSRAAPTPGGRMVLDHEVDATLDELCEAVTYLWSMSPDLQLTIYSGHTIKDQLGTTGYRSELRNTSLWIAQYTSANAPQWPQQQWPVWSLWQWTDRETVPGIAQPVDGNKWNGSEAGLVDFMSPASDSPQPEPQPEMLTIQMTIPVNCSLIVNGQEVYREPPHS